MRGNQVRRPRIFALLGDFPRLEKSSGDHVVEARLLTALSDFADVYYNDQLFRPDAPDWGLDAATLNRPGPGYDLYYVRDNPAVFLTCPSPRVTMAPPFDSGVSDAADALFVTTECWKAGVGSMLSGRYGPPMPRDWYRDPLCRPPRLIKCQWPIAGDFRAPTSRREITTAKAKMSFGRAIGYFGPVEEGAYPKVLTGAFQDLRRALPELQLVFAGDLNIPRPDGVLVLPDIAASELPAYVRASTAIAADEGEAAGVAASRKIAEAIAARVPVIAYRNPAHVEQLGEAYPLYYRDHVTAARRLLEMTFDRDVMAEVRRQLAQRADRLEQEAGTTELQAEVEALLASARVVGAVQGGA